MTKALMCGPLQGQKRGRRERNETKRMKWERKEGKREIGDWKI
jgi:hypothetical protein